MVRIEGNVESNSVKLPVSGVITGYELWSNSDAEKAEHGGESLMLTIDTPKGSRNVFLGLSNYSYKEDTDEDLGNYYGWKQCENEEGVMQWVPPSISEANSLFLLANLAGVEIDLECEEREDALEELLAPIDIIDVTFTPDIVGMYITIDVRQSKNKSNPDSPYQNYAVTSLSSEKEPAEMERKNYSPVKKPKTETTTGSSASTGPAGKSSPANKPSKSAPSQEEILETFSEYCEWFTKERNNMFGLTMLVRELDGFNFEKPAVKKAIGNNMPELIISAKNAGWLVNVPGSAKKYMYVDPNADQGDEEE